MAADEAEVAGPRAFWSGTLSFGLVSVPVDLYPAVRERRVPLRMIGPKGQLLRRRYVCSVDGKPLTNDDIVRGYERERGEFVVVKDEELDALAPRSSRDIDLRRFVAREAIPAELLERPFVLAPAGESTKAYRLLEHTMEASARAGIATFVMRGKEYLAAIFAEDGLLRAEVMRFADEIRTPKGIGLPAVPKIDAKTRKAVDAVLSKLEKDDIDRAALRDEESAALLELARHKYEAGVDIVEVEEAASSEAEENDNIIDIMAVLKQRLGAARAPARAKGANDKEALEDLSKKALYDRAKRLEIEDRSNMSKGELVVAIRKASSSRR